ncbi:DUF4386 domain-containing protein [Dactylosporangium cerinum]|uniref:DUF4386 domain-containing protein n=1 Tax=Dactylosporangium cerinum TaxID=1434730 RepID=A0ABV9W4L3_9ACTN
MHPRVAGVLFILASATAVAGGSLLLPIQQPGYLSTGGRHAQLATGALLEFALAVSVIAIAAVLWPALRRSGEHLAMLYVTTRTLEGVLIAAGATGALVMTSLAEAHASTAAGEVVLSGRDWVYRMGTLVVFGASAVVLNALLLRGRRVPSWLAWWGLIGGGLLLLRGVIEVYGVALPVAAQAVLAAPIGIEEMVFAGWLIVKGLAPAESRGAAVFA